MNSQTWEMDPDSAISWVLELISRKVMNIIQIF